MARLLALGTVVLALTLEFVTSWTVPESTLQLQAQPLVVQLVDDDQDQDDAAGAARFGLSVQGAEGEGEGSAEDRVSDLQLLVPLAVVDGGDVGDGRGEDQPRASAHHAASGSRDASAEARAPRAALARLLLDLLRGDRPRAPSRPRALFASAPAPATQQHHRAQSTSSVCPACLMLKALKILQQQSALQSLDSERGGSSGSGGGGGGCAICVLELQHARRLSAAAGAAVGRSGGAAADEPRVNIVA